LFSLVVVVVVVVVVVTVIVVDLYEYPHVLHQCKAQRSSSSSSGARQ
jgi:type II secretory pathway component PulK